MIEATDYEFGDRPNIYEIEQIIWEEGKGQRYILLIEAYSLVEAIQLSGSDDGVHEIIGARQIGSVCIRSKKVWNKLKENMSNSSSIGY